METIKKQASVPHERNTRRNARNYSYDTESNKTPQKQPSVPCSEKVLIEQNKKLPLRHEPTTIIALLKPLSKALKQQTINPFYKIDLSSYALEYRIYFRIITHFLTLAYQNHRVLEERGYRTTREDVLAALQLLESLGLKQERRQIKEVSEVYAFAKSQFGYQPFKAKELQNAIGMAKTTTHRFLHLLIDRNLVTRTGYNNKGYEYQLLEQE